MQLFEKTIMRIYTLLFSILMLLLAVMTLGWKQPLLMLDLALEDISQRWLLGLIGLALAILGIYIVFFTLRTTQSTHTIIKTTQLGAVSISLDAVEELVIKAAKKVMGIRDIKPIIKQTDNGIAVLIKGSINAEENIPQASVQLQEAVKSTVEQVAGVAVVEVRVIIQAVTKELRGRVE
ncbi:MAG: alkaline shock response membrane anchor protein AmaP [Bacillota bacterium]|nr:alkaline shock response membrane anchor protein AmaP [Bacillota bacterium]